MGQHHILSISSDAIDLNREHNEALEMAIGKAVVSLCAGPPLVNMSGRMPQIVESRDVLGWQNAIRRAGDVHDTEKGVFAWSHAKLRSLDRLSIDELEEIARLVSTAIANRSNC